MITFNSKTLIPLLLTTCLLACGGGGGGSDASPATATNANNQNTESTDTANNTDTSSEAVAEEMIATATIDDIVIADTNILKSTYALNLVINKLDDQRVYVSVCDDYQLDDSAPDSYIVNYESCQIRASITNDDMVFDLTLANHKQNLIAAIWYFDGTPTLFIEWQKTAESAQSWQFSI